MTDNATDWLKYREIITLFLIVVASGTFVSLIAAVPAWLLARKKYLVCLGAVTPFAWLGTVCGLIAGESQEPLIGALLTGMLTIVGAILSYAFSKDTQPEWREVLPFSIMGLCLGALLGIAMGRISKVKLDDYEKEYAIWKTRYEQVEIPVMKEKYRYITCRKQLPSAEAAKCAEILTK